MLRLACFICSTIAIASFSAIFRPAYALDELPSLNYFAVHYLEAADDLNYDGMQLEVSGRVGERWLLQGTFAELSGSTPDTPGSAGRDLVTLRAAFIASQMRRAVLYTGPQVKYVSNEIAFSSSNETDTHFGALAGGRFSLGVNTELLAEVSWLDSAAAGGDHYLKFSAGARMYLTYHLALDARVQAGDYDGFSLGISFNF